MLAHPETVVGANAERSRNHNRKVVLGEVRRAGPIGRAEIARNSGLSTQAVSNIIAGLLEDGLILEAGHRSAGRGLPVVQYAINPSGGFAFGVEIRPDAVFAALLDMGGMAVFSERRALAAPDRATVTATVQALRDAAMRDVPAGRSLGAGIVMPGPFGVAGTRDTGSELPDWEETDPRAWFAEALDLPVFVENDANAAAMAERVAGKAQGLDTYAFLYFGAGLGLGLVQNGQLLTGAFGNAGEIGSITVAGRDGPIVLETAVSRLSVQRHLAGAGIAASSIAELDALHAAGTPALLDWLDRARMPLSAAVEIIENLFDPETILLGGAMPEALLDHLIGGVTLSDRSVSHRARRAHPRLMRGSSGRMTATLGAAALVINQAFTPKIAAAQ